MMEGEPAPPRPRLIPPVRVIARHSTDVLAIDDPEIADILCFIRSRAYEGIRVSDVLRAFSVSHRSLELRFRELLGESPAKKIRKTRLEQARQMLAETHMSLSAAACGISSGVELAHAIRRYFEIRPQRSVSGSRPVARGPYEALCRESSRPDVRHVCLPRVNV